jgi:Protein of unknown function (DUF4038)
MLNFRLSRLSSGPAVPARVTVTALGLPACNCIACAVAEAGDAQFLPSGREMRQYAIQIAAVLGNIVAPASPSKPAYPLKASANKRYLVYQNNVPFLMVGDSPQSLIANLSEADAATYMSNRQKYSVNTLWFSILCNYPDIGHKDASTYDGIVPFAIGGDLSTPNAAYFQRADDMINIAAANGITVLLDPIETSGWLDTLRTNGIGKAFACGEFLGNRYKNFPNIIWMHGNDFQSWQDSTDDAMVQAVARGIRSVDDSLHAVDPHDHGRHVQTRWANRGALV